MVHLHQTWHVLLPHKVGAEEREGVRQVGDVLIPDSSGSQMGIVYVWVRALVFM